MPHAMTYTQALLARRAGRDRVSPGDLIQVDLDLALANDITAPPSIRLFESLGMPLVNPSRIALVPDHFVPNKDIASANNTREMQAFVKKHGLFDGFAPGRPDHGIEHVVVPTAGFVKPGDVIIGADSHTCTYGALGAFATGVGSTDMAAAFATGQAWVRVPEAIRIDLTGALQTGVTGKDVMLALIARLGVSGATYLSLEFTGPGIASLSQDDRFTICNMAVEAGAKNAYFPVDATTLTWLREEAGLEEVDQPFDHQEAPDASLYREVLALDLSAIDPQVARPPLPDQAVSATVLAEEQIAVDQVFIGSCTNGRLSDLRAAAQVLEGQVVAPDVRVMVVPASQRVFKQALAEGLIATFIEAGCMIGTPSCGPCMGGHMGVLAAGEVCLSTSNRNFTGRMGSPQAAIYLAGPYVAAATAVAGYITAEVSAADAGKKVS